jgi:lysophospholipase
MDLVRDALVDALADIEVAKVAGPGGRAIRVAFAPAPAPRGSVVISPGRTECIEKHAETARDLIARGFSVLIVDQRGQGLSDRLAQDPLSGHLDGFSEAGAHLGAAIAAFADRLPAPRLLLCHSMGGAIALQGLIDGTLPGVDGAAFSAPMWGLKAPAGAAALARLMNRIGRGEAIAVTTAKRWAPEPFEGNALTHDPRRFARNNALFLEEPRLQIAGPSNAWVAAAFDFFAGLTPEALAKVDVPVLIVTAEADTVVDNGAHAKVAGLLPNAVWRVMPGAKHEILCERDDLRDRFFALFDEWAAAFATK